MKNITLGTLLLLVCAVGYVFLRSYNQSGQPPVVQSPPPEPPAEMREDSIPEGVFVFDEVAEGTDVNGETTSVWEHRMEIRPDHTFLYSVDGRMALIRVTGDVVVQNNELQFIVRENLSEGELEPYPQFESGAQLFGAKYLAYNDSLVMRWVDAKPNLQTGGSIASFSRRFGE